jgi:hypothetical protein
MDRGGGGCRGCVRRTVDHGHLIDYGQSRWQVGDGASRSELYWTPGMVLGGLFLGKTNNRGEAGRIWAVAEEPPRDYISATICMNCSRLRETNCQVGRGPEITKIVKTRFCLEYETRKCGESTKIAAWSTTADLWTQWHKPNSIELVSRNKK